MLSPGRAAVLAAARASGVVLPDLPPPPLLALVGVDEDDDRSNGNGNSTRPADAAGISGSGPLADVHDSVLEAVLARLDARSKCAAAATCRRLAALLSEPRHWRVLALDSGDGDDDDGGNSAGPRRQPLLPRPAAIAPAGRLRRARCLRGPARAARRPRRASGARA